MCIVGFWHQKWVLYEDGGCRLIDFMAEFWLFLFIYLLLEREELKSQNFMLIWRLWRLSTNQLKWSSLVDDVIGIWLLSYRCNSLLSWYLDVEGMSLMNLSLTLLHGVHRSIFNEESLKRIELYNLKLLVTCFH
jgi:hypothetical protein